MVLVLRDVSGHGSRHPPGVVAGVTESPLAPRASGKEWAAIVAENSSRLAKRSSGRRVAAPLEPADVGIGRLFWVIREAVIVGSVETGRIVLWNPAAEKLFGYSAAE